MAWVLLQIELFQVLDLVTRHLHLSNIAEVHLIAPSHASLALVPAFLRWEVEVELAESRLALRVALSLV